MLQKRTTVVKDQRRRPEGGEWEPIKIPQRKLAYIPKHSQHASLLTQPGSDSYKKATSPQNRVRKPKDTVEENTQCKKSHVRDFSMQNQTY
jgi:hypothetical protein